MPLRGRKRKGYPQKEQIVKDSEDAEEESLGQDFEAVRGAKDGGAAGAGNGIFAAGRFHDLGLAPALSDHIHDKLSFSAPTLIQKSAIPIILSGRDVLVNSGTGSGKTMVYLAPIINALQSYEPRLTRSEGTLALVLVPTRELCLQVCEVAEKVVHRFHWLVPGCVMGGENRGKEKARLRKGVTILVATPGRLLDHLKNTASFRHDRLRWLVFDEADRLLDLGFEKDIEAILEVLGSRDDKKKTRQHILLSATLNERVEQLAALSLVNPATIGLDEAISAEMPSLRETKNGAAMSQQKSLIHDRNTGDTGPSDGYTEYRIPSQLVQSFLKVPCSLRLVALLGLLQQKSRGNGSCKLVVFFSTCDAVDFHYTVVNEFQWSPTPWKDGRENDERKLLSCEAFRLHGSMAQKDRTEAYNQFGKASSAILLCTDVAARGLDFQNVSGIVQYEPPGDAAEYVHRVGRTARLGQKGEAILFLQPSESEYMEELKKHGVTLQELSLPQLLDRLQERRGKKDDFFSAVEMHPLAGLMQKALEAFVAAKPDARLLAVDSFRSYVRAYAAHRGELKSIFQVRKLHLGHVAKSFGLRDAPSLFGKSVNKQNMKKEKERNVKKRFKKKRRLTPGARKKPPFQYPFQAGNLPRPGGPCKQPRTAQLTIFYAGMVNLYDDVPVDKAQAIMLFAGSESTWSSNLMDPPQAGSVASGRTFSAPTTVPLSTPGPPAPQALTTSASGPPSSVLPGMVFSNLRQPSTTNVELPQARKASLARFLEKRKDRVKKDPVKEGDATPFGNSPDPSIGKPPTWSPSPSPSVSRCMDHGSSPGRLEHQSGTSSGNEQNSPCNSRPPQSPPSQGVAE